MLSRKARIAITASLVGIVFLRQQGLLARFSAMEKSEIQGLFDCRYRDRAIPCMEWSQQA